MAYKIVKNIYRKKNILEKYKNDNNYYFSNATIHGNEYSNCFMIIF